MPHKGLLYELSLKADRDLEEIFDYTEHELGIDQAAVYVSAFETVFKQIGKTPTVGKHRREIRVGFRSVIKERHIVFYRILDNRICIVRVLHGSRDSPKFLTYQIPFFVVVRGHDYAHCSQSLG